MDTAMKLPAAYLGTVAIAWGVLHDQWKSAVDDAQMARQAIARRYEEHVDGRAARPTPRQLARLHKLEKAADVYRLAEDAFLEAFFADGRRAYPGAHSPVLTVVRSAS